MGSYSKLSVGIYAFLSILFSSIIICFIYAMGIGTKSFSTNLADGFTIKAYDVTLDVKENNVVDVTEKITVNFLANNKHGIYKYTPYWLKYTSKDGRTISRKSNITNLRSVSDPYSTDIVNKKERIKLGSASEYVKKGLKEYIIKYTYDMGSDPYLGFDEFIFHAYGDYWGTQIQNPTIHVNMPKDISNYNINFFADKYRNNNINKYVKYTVEGNSLTAKVQDMDLFSSLTLDIELPEGYFSKGSYNYGFISLTLILCAIILTIISYYKWLKHGKNFEKVAQTVEFYPPDGLNSAEIGYIYNNRNTSSKLTVSLIVALAGKGYIKIDEEEDKIKITNLYPLVRLDKDSYEYEGPKACVEIDKIKDMDDTLSNDAKTMMTFLFKEGNHKSLTSNIDKFKKVKDELVSNGFINITQDNLNEVEKAEINKETQINELNNKLDQDEKTRNDKMANLEKLNELEQKIYNTLFEKEDEIILSEHPTLYTAFAAVDVYLNNELDEKIYDAEGEKQVRKTFIKLLITVLLTSTAYFLTPDLSPNIQFLYYVGFICIPITFVLMLVMTRKTKYGEQIYARVMGFRNFLETSEKERLEELVMENPNYFYKILPYTYVLGISKKWISKFENIQMPRIDMGTFDYSSDSSYSSLGDVYYPSSYYSSGSSSGGGCSSCGGGCSSCGGGCSSCGGGGSW